jgi:hypothetical protein
MLLGVSILFLVSWAISLVRLIWVLSDLTFKMHRGSTDRDLFFGLLGTFGCYMAYLACGFFSRLFKYPRVSGDL